jgi:hypothetical protein
LNGTRYRPEYPDQVHVLGYGITNREYRRSGTRAIAGFEVNEEKTRHVSTTEFTELVQDSKQILSKYCKLQVIGNDSNRSKFESLRN